MANFFERENSMGDMRKNITVLFILGVLCVHAEKQYVETVNSYEEKISVNNDIEDIQRLIALPNGQEKKSSIVSQPTRVEREPRVKVKKNKKTDYLHYGTIVEISTRNEHIQSKVYVFPSNWATPQEGPADIMQADYELRVGENPVGDTQCSSIGFQFFSIESSGKTSVINYGDPCEIWAYSTSVVEGSPVGWGKKHNVIFPKPFVWYVSDKVAPKAGGNSIFVAHPSRQEIVGGKQLFTFVNPENLADKGPIYQGSDVWIVPQDKQSGKIVIRESSDGSPWYVLEMQGAAENVTSLGGFTISEVVAKNVKGKAKTVYDKLVTQRIIKSPVMPPDGYEKVSGFFVDCFAAKIGMGNKMYAIDSSGSLYSINTDKKRGATAVPVSITDVNDNPLPVIHGVQHEGCFLIVHKETKKVYEQNSVSGDFAPISVTAGDSDMERVSCAKTLALAYALGYNAKPEKRPIYRYASGWVQATDGFDVSVGVDGTVAIIDASGKPMIRNSKTGMWEPLGKSSPSCGRIIVGSRKFIWVIDKDGGVWAFEKNVWSRVVNNDGKSVTGFVSGGATSSGLLILIASSGDAYCRKTLPKDIKKATEKKEKTLGQIRKERKK